MQCAQQVVYHEYVFSPVVYVLTLLMVGCRYDANVSLPGCDKNMPGTIIAMGRLNRPAIMIYGGTIRPGYSQLTEQPIDIVNAFQSYGDLSSAVSSGCSQFLMRV